MNAVANAQVWHRRLGYLHAQSLGILRKRDGTGITFEEAVSHCNSCAVGKTQQLAHPKTANHKVNRSFQLCYGDFLRGPYGALHASGHRRLQVHKQGNRRVHEVDRRLLDDQQEPSSSAASTVRRLDDHSLRRPHRSSARRQRQSVHLQGVSAVLLGDRYHLRVGHHQHATANRCVRTRVSCAPWLTVTFHRPCGGSCSWQLRTSRTEGSAQGAQDGDAIQDASRRGSRSFAPLRHRSQNLRAHQRLQKARCRGLGKEGVRLQREERKSYPV